MVDNLAAIGIEAVAEPMNAETYFSDLADGACKAMCRAGWFADYPTYDNFMFDLFHTASIGGNNLGPFYNEEFDQLVDQAKQTVDADEQASLFQEAERILLNTTPAWCRSTGTSATTSTVTTSSASRSPTKG